MKYLRQSVFTIILLSVILISCNTTKSNSSKDDIFTFTQTGNENKKLVIDMVAVDTMKMIKSGNDSKALPLTDTDRDKLAGLLHSAVYDAEWNESGVMRKMTVPDYTIVISYKNMPKETNDWLQIWRKSNKVKFKNVWYNIPVNVGKDLYSQLGN